MQAIVALANKAMIDTYESNPLAHSRSVFPVEGCMFFGVPHKVADIIASTASRFLSVLGQVFNVNTNNIRDLEAKSGRFANTSLELRTVRTVNGIHIISFFETVKYNRTLGLVRCIFTFS